MINNAKTILGVLKELNPSNSKTEKKSNYSSTKEKKDTAIIKTVPNNNPKFFL